MRPIFLLLLAACATKTASSRHPDPVGAVDRCLAAAESASSFPAAVCAEVWTQPACRQAWVAVASDPKGVTAAQEACREAYCRVLTARPAGCDRPLAEGWDEIQDAAHRADLGEASATRLAEGMARLAERLRARAAEPIAVQPPSVPSAPPVNVALLVGKDLVVVGKTGSEPAFIRRCGAAVDRAALAAALCKLTAEADFAGRQDVELAAEAGATYRDVVAAMDTAVAVGLLDVGVVDPASLSVALTGKSALAYLRPACDQVPSPCKPVAPPPTRAPTSAPAVGITLPPAEQQDQLKRAPIVSVEGNKILLNGEPVAEVSGLPPGEWKIVGLFEALRDLPKSSVVILQADPATDAAVINNVIKTLYAAERPNIMFATKPAKSR